VLLSELGLPRYWFSRRINCVVEHSQEKASQVSALYCNYTMRLLSLATFLVLFCHRLVFVFGHGPIFLMTDKT